MMASEFQKVAIVGRHDDPRVAEAMAALVGHLTKSGIEVMAAEDMALDLSVTRMAESSLAAQVDLMMAIGGDGTMLHAGGLAWNGDVPLLGINRGRLGFLADVTPDEMLASVDSILAGDYSAESRLLLDAQLVRGDGQVSAATAFNDIVLQRRNTGRMVDFETRVADHLVTNHSGDGLVVATPTGSTAYALSCGGPIIEPQLEAVVIVPICPHTLTYRPIVIPSSHAIEIRLHRREDTGADITVDGHSIGAIQPNDKLLIRASDSRITLIHPTGYDYYEILRSKLFWGRDNRIRDERTDSD